MMNVKELLSKVGKTNYRWALADRYGIICSCDSRKEAVKALNSMPSRKGYMIKLVKGKE